MAAQRDSAAEAYRLYGPTVYRRCLRLLGDAEAARDATQEVFARLVREREWLEGREQVLPWIHRVATNHCLNLLRDARGRRSQSAGEELPLAGGPSPEPYPERQLAHQVLERFSTRTRAVALGVLVNGMEHQEVAQALGLSTRTVARRLSRFLDGARKFLTRSAS